MNLFQLENFVGASGRTFDWKIECDALSRADWECIAKVGVGMLQPFGSVMGVPRGGFPLAQAFRQYVTLDQSRILVVDDVWSTGSSIGRFTTGWRLDWTGFVAFSRSTDDLPANVRCFLRAG